jgi:mono/diheme cytochrome c family protein
MTRSLLKVAGNKPERTVKPMCELQIKSSYRFGAQLCAAMLMAMMLRVVAFGAEETNDLAVAKALFVKTCAPCHSKDGTAQTPAARALGVKDLSQSKLADSQIIHQILEGKQENQSTSKMPPFKEKLTRTEVESLVPLVKGFRK